MKQVIKIPNLYAVESNFGEVTRESAKMASDSYSSCQFISVICSIGFLICLGFSVGLLVNRNLGPGLGFSSVVPFLLYGHVRSRRLMVVYESIEYAYYQGEALKRQIT